MLLYSQLNEAKMRLMKVERGILLFFILKPERAKSCLQLISDSHGVIGWHAHLNGSYAMAHFSYDVC